MMRRLTEALGSLRLTCSLLFLSAVLVFFATLDQVRYGILTVQDVYFHGFIAFWAYPQSWPLGAWLSWLHLPIPGGYLLGPLLLANLACAHLRRFRLRWNYAGTALIHTGIALLLIGQWVTDLTREDGYVPLRRDTGTAAVRQHRSFEIAFTPSPSTGTETLRGRISRPLKSLRSGQPLPLPELGVVIHPLAVLPNARVEPRSGGSGVTPEAAAVDRGLGRGGRFDLIPQTATVAEEGGPPQPAAVVRIDGADDSPGSWLLSPLLTDPLPPQVITINGTAFRLALEPAATALPYALRLEETEYETHPGTDVPQRVASIVEIEDLSTGQRRSTRIGLNEPLRLGAWTFYQDIVGGRKSTLLQASRIPGRSLPYVAGLLVITGMAFHFLFHFFRPSLPARAQSR